MRQKALIAMTVLLLSLPGVTLAARGNGDGNGNPGTSHAAQSNGNSNSNSNPNRAVQSKSASQGPDGNTHNQSVNGSAAVGGFSATPTRFGDNDQDEVVTTDQAFDNDADDGTNFTTSGTITSLTNNTLTLSNGQSFTLTPAQFSFLTTNGVLVSGATVQVIGNHASNGNTVSIVKVMSPTGGPIVMARLHTNNQVSQASVRTRNVSSNPLSAFFAQIMSLLTTLVSGGTTPSPSPSPSMTPTPSPTASPSESPSVSPSATP